MSDLEAKLLSESPKLYSSGLGQRTPRHGKVWRNYQIAYDLNDLCAGILFVVGSVLFFDESLQGSATTLFLIGSVLFCVRPLIHVLRDLHLTQLPE